MMAPIDLLPAAVGPFVGSFLALAAVRLPAGEPIALGRSRCRSCGARLGPLSLVPLLSWLALRGRCNACGARIGVLYPLIELAALGLPLWAATVLSGWPLWATAGLGWALLLLAAIDLRALYLPDAVTLPLIPAGLAVIAAIDPTRLGAHLLGAAAGFVAFAALRWAYRRLRGRAGLGLGDAKLLAAGGAWTGWEGLSGIVLWASAAALAAWLLAALRRGRIEPDRPIAFGPFLCLGIWLVWLYGPIGLR